MFQLPQTFQYPINAILLLFTLLGGASLEVFLAPSLLPPNFSQGSLSVITPLTKWDKVQRYSDCVCGLGRWVKTNTSQVLFESGVRGVEMCGSPPWTYPSAYFTWGNHPPQCLKPAWNLTDFCHILGGRDVVIVGDSVSFAYHEALLSALFPNGVPGRDGEFQHHQFEVVPHAVCGQALGAPPASLVYVRNDFSLVNPVSRGGSEGDYYSNAGHPLNLSGYTPPVNHDQGVATGTEISFPQFKEYRRQRDLAERGRRRLHSNAWIHLVTSNTLLLINRGAHYHSDDEVVNTLRETFIHIHNTQPEAVVVFRNTPPGHKDLIESEPLLQRQYLDIGDPSTFNWDRFAEQNKAVRAMMEELRVGWGMKLLYLDVDASTSLYIARHRDGLHYCVPGGQDHWTELFYAVLKKAVDLGAITLRDF